MTKRKSPFYAESRKNGRGQHPNHRAGEEPE